MGSPDTSDAPIPLKKRDYVSIETDDEWDGLIGIIEDFLDAEGNSVSASDVTSRVMIRIPLTRQGQNSYRLLRVNFLTDYVRILLRENNENVIMPREKVEYFDPADLA